MSIPDEWMRQLARHLAPSILREAAEDMREDDGVLRPLTWLYARADELDPKNTEEKQMEDKRTAEDKLAAAEKMTEQALRIIGILTRQAGGEVVVSETEMVGTDNNVETSLDALSGAMTIRATPK